MREQRTDIMEERRFAVSVNWLKPEAEEGANRNGLIYVSDGQMYILEPLGLGNPAVLVPGQTLRMYVDGVQVNKPISLYEGQQLEVVVPHKEPSRALLLQVSQNGLEAELRAELEDGFEYGLRDSPHTVRLSLEAELKHTKNPQRFTKKEVLEFLQNRGITYGLIEQNIDYFVETQDGNPVVVAKGKPPILPQDARIDFKVRFETERILAQEDEVRVDFRQRFFIPAVNEGDLLAEVIPGKPGEPGIKVTGEEIPVKEPREIEVTVGKGAMLSPDSKYVYAAKSGRPICQRYQISVEPIFVVEGDVDLKQGNVAFTGDVLIKGSVEPNFEVSSGGSINIQGTVSKASVRSRADLVIGGNAICSTIIAASSQTPYPELIKLYAQIAHTLRKVVAAVNQVKVASALRNIVQSDGQFVRQVIDLKFGELPLVVKRLQDVFIDPEDDLQETLQEINQELADTLLGHGPRKIEDVNELNEMVRKLVYITRELEVRSRHTYSNIVLPYAQNCQIEATGTVNVLRGCYYSNIVAGKGIIFGKESFFRGGSMVVFEGDITAGTIGSPAGAKTEITIVKKGVLTAREVFFNVQVSINMRRYTFSRSYRDVKLYVNNEGKLEFEGLKIE